MVKKLNKKIMVMVLSGVIGAMSCMPVLAAEDATVHVHEGECCVAEENVSPFGLARAYTCDVCGKGTVFTTITPSGWAYLGTTDCEKVKGATDIVYVQVTDYVEACDNRACGVSYSYSTTDYDISCSH